MRLANVTGRLSGSARLTSRVATVTVSSVLVVSTVSLVFSLGCSHSTDTGWKSQKSYGAKMAQKGYWREARFRFERAAAEKPDDPQVQNDLAVSYEGTGETAKALAAYKKALELAPNDARIKRNYARFAEYYTAVQRAGSAGGARPAASPTPAPGAPQATPSSPSASPTPSTPPAGAPLASGPRAEPGAASPPAPSVPAPLSEPAPPAAGPTPAPTATATAPAGSRS